MAVFPHEVRKLVGSLLLLLLLLLLYDRSFEASGDTIDFALADAVDVHEVPVVFGAHDIRNTAIICQKSLSVAHVHPTNGRYEFDCAAKRSLRLRAAL